METDDFILRLTQSCRRDFFRRRSGEEVAADIANLVVTEDEFYHQLQMQ